MPIRTSKKRSGRTGKNPYWSGSLDSAPTPGRLSTGGAARSITAAMKKEFALTGGER
jgi:hypothetical protein